ncbi:unnamed protein product [Cylindrotheca closterium]|uniref:Leucine-rich repeat-containing N-terminal plant-type domain-containing protein n=1 Tax=Cylindrotheca closterium TaxID=2856 RepID=A0AAD2G4I2_9STRA|nr:unnamed protein product [Cylindrotheca closterium]
MSNNGHDNDNNNDNNNGNLPPPAAATSASLPNPSANSMNARIGASSVFSNMSEDERQQRYEAKMKSMGIHDAIPQEKPETESETETLDSLKRSMSVQSERNRNNSDNNNRSNSSAINPAGQVVNRSISLNPSTSNPTGTPSTTAHVDLVEQERQRRYDAKMAAVGLAQPEPEKEQPVLHPDHQAQMTGKLSVEPTSGEMANEADEKNAFSSPPAPVYDTDAEHIKEHENIKNLNYAHHKNNPNNMMDADLAVAMAINEEEEMEKGKDETIVYAIEYDPESKPPLHKNRRFQLYGFIGFLVVVLVAAGAAVGVGGGGGETTIVDAKSLQGELGPTNSPTVYLTPEEQVVYSFLSLHFSPKVREEGTPHHMAAQWVLYEDPYSQDILKDLSNVSGSLDVQFLQRYVLAFLWFHSTNIGKDPWRSCNPPTFKSMNLLDTLVTPSAGRLVTEGVEAGAEAEADADSDTCTFLQWNRLENDAVCFGAVPGVHRWMSSADTCQWQGVDCSTGTEVLGLDLFWQGLSGTLPSELMALTSLQKISFAYNQLTGTIPGEYARLRTLFALELHGNLLTGTIPDSYYEAASETGALVLLNVGDNQLTGTLDTRLGLMTDLKGFHFFDNSFNGPIPTEIGNLRYLSYSRGYGNNLSGSLPTEVGKLRQMNEFWYYQMGLTGPIPSEIGNMKRLQYLRLWGNDLNGSIPEAFYSLRKLEQVALQENSLTGTISTSISNMMALEALRVSSNKLRSTIPTEVGDLLGLKVAWFHQNEMTGTMPEQVCRRGLIGLQADCDPEGAAAVECTCCSSCCEQGLGLGTCFFREGYGEPTLPPNTFDDYVMCEP